MTKVGVIPYQTQKDALAVLFVTSQTRGRWILPKGRIRGGDDAVDTCHRVAFEEAGVRGVMLEKYPITVVVGKQTETGLEKSPVTYYPYLVQKQEDDWPEKDQRERHWALVGDASKVAYREDYRGLIDVLQDLQPWLKGTAEAKTAAE